MPAAGLSTASARRRSLTTAAAAGAVLCALWFVPSANAAPDAAGTATVGSARAHTSEQVPRGSSSASAGDARAAGTGHGATTPYVLGGLGLAGACGFLIVRARRRPAASAPAASDEG